MKKRIATHGIVTVWIACAAFISHADSTNTMSRATSPDGPPSHTIFLTGKEKAWNDFPKSPAPGSAVDLADLAITLSVQASRTDDQKNEALRDRQYSIKLITDVIDPAFETKYPKTFTVLGHADNDSYFINTMLKTANARLRPYVQHPTLVVPLFPARDTSYPSGHASGLELQARILGSLFHAQADDLLKRARQVADSRVVAGVHYASDTEAGLILGDLLFHELDANPKFKAALKDAASQDNMPLQ